MTAESWVQHWRVRVYGLRLAGKKLPVRLQVATERLYRELWELMMDRYGTIVSSESLHLCGIPIVGPEAVS